MSTSLATQLQRLRVPQTIALTDTRQRTSILFASKEAASKDRRTIYDIGFSGLQELIALNPHLQQFEKTLFDENTLHMERGMELASVNEILDENIAKFLRFLSPYFLLRPTHMCLEWLIRRFYVHEFNRSALLALALPYHETNMFVRVLKLMRLRKGDTEWHWLKPLRRTGLPLTKALLINRAVAEPSFLGYLCKSTMDVVREFGPHAHILQAQLNHYAVIVVGTLEAASVVQEKHVLAILPSLLMGLASSTLDFASAAYMIAAQLVARTPIKAKLCTALCQRVAAVSFENLRPIAVLVLLAIFDKQRATLQVEPLEATLLQLIKQKWLTEILAKLCRENVDIYPFCALVLRWSVNAIYEAHSESAALKEFLNKLIADVQFPAPTAQRLMRDFIGLYVAPALPERPGKRLAHGDVIELGDSDDGDDAAACQTWFANYLQKLQRQYPTVFDQTVKEILQSTTKQSAAQRLVLKMLLGVRLERLDDGAINIYESLYHHNANIRLLAVETLLANVSDAKKRPQSYELLQECLADRLCREDSAAVVAVALQLPTNVFIDILGADPFLDALLEILNKGQLDERQWSPLLPAIIGHLISAPLVKHCDSNAILMALMPLLLPIERGPAATKIIQQILKSSAAKRIGLLKQLNASALLAKENAPKVTDFKKEWLNVLAEGADAPPIAELLQSVQSREHLLCKSGASVSHLLLMLNACLNRQLDGATSAAVFDAVCKYTENFQIVHTPKRPTPAALIVPLQFLSDLLPRLVARTDIGDALDWETPSAGLSCVLRIAGWLATGAVRQTSADETTKWLQLLRAVLKAALRADDDPSALLDFLTHFYVYQNCAAVPQYQALRLVAFKLLNATLKGEELELNVAHIVKICIGLSAALPVLRLQALATLDSARPALTQPPLRAFVERLLARSEEIGMDEEQFSLVLYTLLHAPAKGAPPLDGILPGMLQLLRHDTQSGTCSEQILQTIKHINSADLLGDLIPLAAALLERHARPSADGAAIVLRNPHSQIYQRIIERYDHQTIESVLLDNPAAWQLLELTLKRHDVLLTVGDKLLPLPCVLLNALDETLYARMPAAYRVRLLQRVVETLACADNDTIFLAAKRLLKHCVIDCAAHVSLLEGMYSGAAVERATPPAGKRGTAPSQLPIETLAWKQGVALLELLENQRELSGAHTLIPTLFELLKRCLAADEQAVGLEYGKQLILGALQRCMDAAQLQCIDLALTVPHSVFRVDQIVECLRTTQNPQTQHNSLLLLGRCARVLPQLVLEHIVAVFTFMGSSVVRHDDAFSFHIIDSIIESVVPILIGAATSSSSADSAGDSQVIAVLKVFSDILPDVPEHRRLPLYVKLLHTLDARRYLWQLLCIVFDAHILDDDKRKAALTKRSGESTAASAAAASGDKFAQRIRIALELTGAFEPAVMLDTCIQLMNYVQTLPLSSTNEDAATGTAKRRSATQATGATEVTLFDANSRSSKQLRHYKYTILQFLSTLTASQPFLQRIAALSADAASAMKPYYQSFIIATLSFVPLVNAAIERVDAPAYETKFWKVILHHVHDVLDNAISLLSPDMFLAVVRGLMQHQVPGIRRKVIELLIGKLQRRDEGYFDGCEAVHFHKLLKPLNVIVDGITESGMGAAAALATTPGMTPAPANEPLLIQQNALIAIKLLSKTFALQFIDDFKALLAKLTKLLRQRRANLSKIIVATIILAIVDISCNLKAHSLAHLPKYAPSLLAILQEQSETLLKQPPDQVCVSLITALQKLVDSLPLFLGPYLVDIILMVSSLMMRLAAHSHRQKDARTLNAQQRLAHVWAKLGADVPLRVLVPCCEQAYERLLAGKCYAEIGMLMKLLQEALHSGQTADVSAMQKELTALFLSALSFRAQLSQSGVRAAEASSLVTATEDGIIEAFVMWVLKLSESSFRPLYQRVYEWALKSETPAPLLPSRHSVLTFFRLTRRISAALKSLFALFAGDLIEDTAQLLHDCNTLRTPLDPAATRAPEEQEAEEQQQRQLIEAIMGTLHNVVLYDNKNFMTAQRFKLLLQPLVDQLENTLVLDSEPLQASTQACIAQLAVATCSDIMWKQLNYQVLLKTRTSVPEVQMLALQCCVEIARKLGDDFTALLPETVPFVAELFEDDNARVQKCTRQQLQELEAILGESLQKYL